MVCFRALNIDRDWAWVHERANPVLCENTNGIVAERDGKPIAAAIFDQWTASSCQVHICMDDPFVIRHGFFREVCTYVFVTCGRKCIIGLTPADNERAVRFNRHVGMREIYRIEDAIDEGIDYIVVRMDRDECRWIEQERNLGKEVRAKAA